MSDARLAVVGFGSLLLIGFAGVLAAELDRKVRDWRWRRRQARRGGYLL